MGIPNIHAVREGSGVSCRSESRGWPLRPRAIDGSLCSCIFTILLRSKRLLRLQGNVRPIWCTHALSAYRRTCFLPRGCTLLWHVPCRRLSIHAEFLGEK